MKMTRDMVLLDGKLVCPKCLERKFKEIREAHSYVSLIKDYDVTEDGKFMFTYVCANCNIQIAECLSMNRKGVKR